MPEDFVMLLDRAGPRGFCAGGDVAVHQAATEGERDFLAGYWREEYRLNAAIAVIPSRSSPSSTAS